MDPAFLVAALPVVRPTQSALAETNARHTQPPMYTATFTFAKRGFDDAFRALDQVIADVAKSIPGYQVTIAQVQKSYGDGGSKHPLAAAQGGALAASGTPTGAR